ncbi:MAG: hypothetical protein R3C60_12855 [Parvularculaceae bacterium]
MTMEATRTAFNGDETAERLSGEEELRFIRNFHDVFLSLGIAMFSAGLAIATAVALGPVLKSVGQDASGPLLTIAGAAGVDAVIMWLMAEFFARGRRLFLPSIVILIGFSMFMTVAAAAIYGWHIGADREFFDGLEHTGLEGAVRKTSEALIFIGGVTTLAIFAFYARMKLPFAMGLGGYALAGTGAAAIFWAFPNEAVNYVQLLQLGSGVFLFLLGVYFDARDPERKSRISDNGFWLHFFAAPLILNSALGMAVGAENIIAHQTGAAVTVLVIVFSFAFVSLLINRRALLVAGLIYALIAGGFLISKVGLSGGWTLAVTLLVMGGAMVLLGGGWHALRRIVVAPFPKEGLIARIVPPEPPKEARGRQVSE